MKERYLLDTNMVIALFSGETAITDFLSRDASYSLSVIVYGELLQGALYTARILQNVTKLDSFVRQVPLISCDQQTAVAYAEIGADLRKRGKPIPDNDIWIAATARQHGLTLLTRDNHFSYVLGLKTESARSH